MKTMLSCNGYAPAFASGRNTALKMLRREVFEDEDLSQEMQDALSRLTSEGAGHLRTITEELSRPEARDPMDGVKSEATADLRDLLDDISDAFH